MKTKIFAGIRGNGLLCYENVLKYDEKMILFIITCKIRRKFRNGTVFQQNESAEGFRDP